MDAEVRSSVHGIPPALSGSRIKPHRGSITPTSMSSKRSASVDVLSKRFSHAREFVLQDAWERKRQECRGLRKNAKAQQCQGIVKADISDQTLSRRISIIGRDPKKSVTDDDFEELRGCIDLGFGFGDEFCADLCDTLPALKVCYAIRQTYTSFMAGGISSQQSSEAKLSPNHNYSWEICHPGEHPQQVKAKLRHWAQAVACTVRQSC